jgi:hypothetical protein
MPRLAQKGVMHNIPVNTGGEHETTDHRYHYRG